MHGDLREPGASHPALRRNVVIVALTCLLGSVPVRPNRTRLTNVASGGFLVGAEQPSCSSARLPAWTAPALSNSSPGPTPWPAALSERGTVATVVFGYPLRAGNPTGPMNKVLWSRTCRASGGVCAPSKTERPPADRIKTDKDAPIRSARLLAAGRVDAGHGPVGGQRGTRAIWCAAGRIFGWI